MKKEDLLKLLNKYGFHSNRKDPFLYVGEEGMGLSYTIKDSFYGTLTRIFLPETLESAEIFLQNYYQYKKNEKKIQLLLNDYKSKAPSVTFEDIQKKEIEELDIDEDEKSILDQNYLKKLKRTLNILLQIIEEKIKVQKTTYQNLIEFTNKYIEKQNEYHALLATMEKKSPKVQNLVKEQILSIPSLDEWKEIEKTEEKEVLEESIYTLINFIKNLEIEEGLLKNKYELIKLPILISIVNEKIEYLKKNQQKKKGIFGKKENLEESLKAIEEKSTLKNIVTFDHYKENELSRIEEKYAVVADLDIRTVGDYLVEFDNLKIQEPILEKNVFIPTQNLKEKEYTFEEVMEILEDSYRKRPKEEQELLVSYIYLTKHVLGGPKEQIDEFLNRLHNPNNIMIQVKYFKNLEIENHERFLKSVEKLIEKVKQLEFTPLLGSINVFFKSSKNIITNDLLKTSSKRILSPIQSIGDNDCAYIAKIEKKVEVLFVPEELILDSNDDTFSLKKETPYLLINLEKNQLNEENSDIIKVVDYEIDKRSEDKITVVTNLKRKKINLYKKIKIERKDYE